MNNPHLKMWVSSSETSKEARFTTQYLRHCCSFAKCGYRSIHPPFKNGCTRREYSRGCRGLEKSPERSGHSAVSYG